MPDRPAPIVTPRCSTVGTLVSTRCRHDSPSATGPSDAYESSGDLRGGASGERRSAWLDVGTDGDRDPGFGGSRDEWLDGEKGRKTQACAGHHAADRQDGDD